MRRFMIAYILVGLLLFIVIPVLYFSGIFGPEDPKDTTAKNEITASTEATDPEHEDIEVEEETFQLDVDKEIAEAQKNNPDATADVSPDHTHDYNSTVISPSCNRQGYTLHSCECGDTYKDNVKEKLSHNYTSQVISATEKSGGYTLYTCSICGEEYKDNFTDPIQGSSNETTLPEPTPPETTTEPTKPDPTEPSKSEQPEYNPTPDEEDLSNPNHEDNDHGDCPKCGLHLWTYWDQNGCFTFLVDTTCECGVFVEAGECHHH